MIRKIVLKILRLVMSPISYAKYIGVKWGNGGRCSRRVEFGSEPYLIKIGDNCTITSGVNFVTHDGSACLAKDEKGRRYYYAPIVVGNNVFIGINSIIMPGVCIDDNVIIGAGSIVTKSIPSGYIVAGNPAKIIGTTASYIRRCLEKYVSESDFISKDKKIIECISSFKDYMKL